jgi:hypothetical protein
LNAWDETTDCILEKQDMGFKKTETLSDAEARDANRDPLTGTPGAHPVGVGAGAAGAGAAGAAIGAAVGGPVGAAVGAVAGAVGGGLAGKAAAEGINPTVEHQYWREEYTKRPYVTKGSPYEQYGPAYQYGWESYSRCSTKDADFAAVEADLGKNWKSKRGSSPLDWEHARDATKDAWERAAKNKGGCCDC